MITVYANAQLFDFESDKKNKSNTYHKALAEALDKNNIRKVKKILNKKPELVNSLTNYSVKSKRYSKRLSAGSFPMLYDAVQRYLNDECSYEMLETIMSYKPFLYCTHNGTTPFYLLLDFLAKHKIEDSKKAEELVYLFCQQEGFNAGQRQANTPPPLSFLMIENRNFLNYKVSDDYLSTDILKALILKGANINALDDKKNNLLFFSLERNRDNLTDFLLEQGISTHNKNIDGKDAFLFAIERGNVLSLRKIYNNGYKVSLNDLYHQNIENSLNSYPKVKDFIYEIANDKKNMDINESIGFLGLFNQEGDVFVDKHFKNITHIEKNEFIQLLNFISEKNIKITPDNYLKLNLYYLRNSVDVEELWSNASKINF